MKSPFSSFLENDFEVSKGSESVIRVLVIVSDLFQNGAENGMFGHPDRNAFSQVTPISRFLYDDTYSCMVTRYGPLTKILNYMGRAMIIACLSTYEEQ